MTDTIAPKPQAALKPLAEAVVEAVHGEPCEGLLSFRCTKRLEVALRRTAVIHRIELSSLMRQLLREAAEARGIDLSL